MTKAQRLDSAVRPPSEDLDRLDDMYWRIRQRLLSHDIHSKSLDQNALTWAAHSSLQSPELRDAICPEGWDMDGGGTTTRFDHAVVLSCCGLIEKGAHGTYQYIHLTALDFVQRSGLIPPPPEAKATMAGRCISYLAFSLPQKPLSGDMHKSADRIEVRRKWPLLQVSAAGWASLAIDALMMEDSTARKSEVVEEMITLGLRYLKMGLGLMVWIESLYTLGVATSLLGYQSSSQRYSLGGKVSGSSQTTIFLQGLERLMEDVKAMHREWGPSLEESPAEIWRDITAFTTSKFLVKTKAVQVETLTSDLRISGTQDPELSVKPTFSTSTTSPDASLLANLGIFPSKYFRMGWNEYGDIPCCKDSGTISRPKFPFQQIPRCPQTLQEVQDTCIRCFWSEKMANDTAQQVFVSTSTRHDA
ncbi:uncharacterized protein LY79DRAFT_678607 [Colletotrichum navitas]|uniref:Uncharacterized protein n=1 Tax=Colletotrichum navitas TaxID=681940 RepID=A0AAD8PMG1_9PEZI|nr:uncharacterized protein LY79DRAFT_678607 [Colletotrichum navitas]KAK1569967.1 hypothetical protein LY79DRAFT_678607 [Colletotrichum navitas]